jgi:uncharacterized membrane-anchored protein YitT (DUF2179 family)
MELTKAEERIEKAALSKKLNVIRKNYLFFLGVAILCGLFIIGIRFDGGFDNENMMVSFLMIFLISCFLGSHYGFKYNTYSLIKKLHENNAGKIENKND